MKWSSFCLSIALMRTPRARREDPSISFWGLPQGLAVETGEERAIYHIRRRLESMIDRGGLSQQEFLIYSIVQSLSLPVSVSIYLSVYLSIYCSYSTTGFMRLYPFLSFFFFYVPYSTAYLQLYHIVNC